MAEQVGSLKTGVKYTDTPIGKIPVDWEVTSLGRIAYLEYGASLPEEKRKKGNCPVYGSNGIVGYHSKALVDGPGIVVGRKGTVGAVSWADKDFWPIDTTYYISAKECKEYLKWMFCLLSSLNLGRLNITTGVPRLNREQAHSVIVPVPPHPEQKRIAGILTTVDAAIEKTTQIIDKTKELKKGLVKRLFLPQPSIKEQEKIVGILNAIDDKLEKESNHKEKLELLKKGLMQALLTGKVRVTG
jgi:type I restriction enzyme S subunit